MMLEVCFNDSVKGTLASAQNCGKKIGKGPFEIITDKKGIFAFLEKRKVKKRFIKRQEELRKIAVPLGGKKEDILGVSFNLSEGDIVSEISLENCVRKDYIYSKFAFDRYNERINMKKSIDGFWINCINDLERLKLNPEKIRVWLDNSPEARCGLLFVADLLKDSKTEIRIVELPKKIIRENNTIIEYRGWTEIAPEIFGTFLKYERVLLKEEVLDLASKWKKLKQENTPLRVVEDDLVISKDIDYYDDLIRKEFPKNKCKVVEIIGLSLGNQKILRSDVFIAKRIQEFIKNNELKIISDENKGFYNAVVSRIEQ